MLAGRHGSAAVDEADRLVDAVLVAQRDERRELGRVLDRKARGRGLQRSTLDQRAEGLGETGEVLLAEPVDDGERVVERRDDELAGQLDVATDHRGVIEGRVQTLVSDEVEHARRAREQRARHADEQQDQQGNAHFRAEPAEEEGCGPDRTHG